MTRHILAVHFVPTGVDAVVLFDDGKFGRVSGLIATKWRAVMETLVRYEIEQDFTKDVLDEIREALK